MIVNTSQLNILFLRCTIPMIASCQNIKCIRKSIFKNKDIKTERDKNDDLSKQQFQHLTN